MFDAQHPASKLFKIAKKMGEKSGGKLGAFTNAEKLKKAKDSQKQAQSKKTSSQPNENAFQEQIPKLTKKLFGHRFQKASGFIGRFVPEAIVNNVSDKVFMKIAALAEQWSKSGLDDEFKQVLADVSQLSEEEKATLAQSIANQHRALAAAGSGITGLTGLVGTVADLLWLLLLSLRLIYQTAALYNEPLTGTAGAKRAFDILGSADLSMLTEKQAVLISLVAAGEIADDIDLQVLEGLVKSDSDVAFFREAVTSIAEQLNINLSMNWLLKFLPFASGLTSAVYSVYIMNEISAVVSAEYTGKPVHTMKLVKSDD